MKFERMILVAFFANYIINEVVGGLSALVPVSAVGNGWAAYSTFVVLAAVTVGFFTWWFIKTSPASMGLRTGVILGMTGVLVSFATTFVSGIFGTLFDTGSLLSAVGVVPNFPLYLWDISTLVLIGYWVIPAAAVGWYLEKVNAPTA